MKEIDRRIFVVGVPRSGTTLVQSLLAAHDSLTSFTESHFFDRHFKPLPFARAILRHSPERRLGEFLTENGVEAEAAVRLSGELDAALPPRLLLPVGARPVARALLGILDQLADLRGHTGWIEKTPRHLRYLPFLEGLYDPGQRPHFVHVIRDGLETVASLRAASRSWERSYDLATCVARWNADVAYSLARARSRPALEHFVFYEQLTSRPEATLERLFADLDLDWQPEILDRYSASRLVTSEETWKAGVDRGVSPSATSGQVLSRSQRDRARRSLRGDLYARLFELTTP